MKEKDLYETLAWELRVFATVAEMHSMKDAATRLGISAPAVTRALQRLEKKVGLGDLRVRSSKSLALTEAGQIVLSDAHDALRFIGTLLQRRNGLAANRSLPLTVLCPQMMLHTLTAAAGLKFRSLSPALQFSLRSLEQSESLRTPGMVVLSFEPNALASVVAWVLGEERWVFVASPDREQRLRREVPSEPSDFEKLRFFKVDLDDGGWCVSARRPSWTGVLLPTEVSGVADTVLQMAIAGHGVALMPRWLAASSIDEGSLVQVFEKWAVRPASGARVLRASADAGAMAGAAQSRFVSFVKEWFGQVNEGADRKSKANTWQQDLRRIRR